MPFLFFLDLVLELRSGEEDYKVLVIFSNLYCWLSPIDFSNVALNKGLGATLSALILASIQSLNFVLVVLLRDLSVVVAW